MRYTMTTGNLKALTCMKQANDSLSQRPLHQAMVTRLPNHWWASSWVTTVQTRWRWEAEAVTGSTRRSTSRYVTRPQFSMAPAANSGCGGGGEGEANRK